MLDVLRQGLEMNFESIVLDYKNEKLTPLTPHARLRIHQKCLYMTCALEKALVYFPSNIVFRWKDICEEVIHDFSHQSFLPGPKIESEKTIRRWFVSFKKNGRKLVVPSISGQHNSKINKPPMLKVYPEFYESLVEFCTLNISDLSADTVHKYINKCVSTIANNQQMFETVEIDENDNVIISINEIEKTVPEVDLRSQFKTIANDLIATETDIKETRKLLLKDIGKKLLKK